VTNAPLFTVVVTTFRRPLLFQEAIASVLAQTVDDLECIVVDDASPDPVTVLPDDPRVRLVRRHVNGGVGAARNTGLDLASGRFVTMLDDDDLLTPSRLEMVLPALESAPVVVCWTRFLDAPVGSIRTLKGNVRGIVHEGLIPNMAATTVRREAYLRFDERLRSAEDVEWWIRISEAHTVATVPGVGHLFRRHSGPRHGNDDRVRLHENLDILRARSDYFGSFPKAAAFRWRRVGLLARGLGDHRLARLAFRRSFRIRPSTRAVWHLARSARGSTGRINEAWQRIGTEVA
jgi:glycosyltransferase involved in cell wall biosynthesis